MRPVTKLKRQLIVRRLARPSVGAQVARIEPVVEEPILWRRNRELLISVRADIRDGVQAPDVTNAILPALAPIKAALPPGAGGSTGCLPG